MKENPHYRNNGEWKPVKDQFDRKLSSWIGKLLSYGDRLIVVNSVVTSLPTVWEVMGFMRRKVLLTKDNLVKWN
jgi:hypothetical protein